MEEEKRVYMQINPGPLTQKTDIPGLEYDFNYGARIKVPAGNWRIRLIDQDTCITVYDAKTSDALITSTKKYYVNFRLEAYLDDKLFFSHNYNAQGKKVLIKYPVGILGDTIAFFPYVQSFQEKHNCEVYCALAPEIAGLFKNSYPQLHFIGPEEKPEGLYATYYMGIYFPPDNELYHPVDWRIVGLCKITAYMLGLEAKEIRPKIEPKTKIRKIKEPYVCIAAQSTTQAKYWNHPTGWYETIKYLEEKGYRVLCIDKSHSHGVNARHNLIPYGAENFTGDIPLQERVDLLYHADFFIGLSSGLSWLAWAVGKPVIMISGLTLPINEFATPYRIINYHVCNGCWNDTSIEFDHKDFEWCPRHKGDEKHYECTRFISPEQVIKVIGRLMKDYNLK